MVHRGSSTFGGHYYAYFKHGEHCFGFNDLKTPTSWHEPGMGDTSLLKSSPANLKIQCFYWLNKTQLVYNYWELQMCCLNCKNCSHFHYRSRLKFNQKSMVLVDFAHFHDVHVFQIVAKFRDFQIPYRNTLEGILHLWKKSLNFAIFA